MQGPRFTRSLVAAAVVLLAGVRGTAQTTGDPRSGSAPSRASAAPPWRDSVRAGIGPSVRAPPSDFRGSGAPSRWCLQASGRSPGDFGVTGQSWTEASRSWLHDVLTDTTDLGDGWRKVLGGAPRLAARDSIVQLSDERVCHEIAETINRGLLGWPGAPTVVVFRVRDYLIAYPSNAQMGEFGLAVGMNTRRQIRAVATW